LNIAILGIKRIPAIAGADRVVEKLLENFSLDNDYWIYVRADGGSGPLDRKNVHLIPMRAPNGKHLGSFFFFFFSSMHYLFRSRYDLAHIHNSDFGIFSLIVRLKPGVPVLGTFHGDPYVRQKWGRFARAFLRLSERFFVQFSHRLTSVSKFKSIGRGLFKRAAIDYVPNGVDPYFGSDAVNVPVEIADLEDYLLFACGRLDATKGLHHLLNAYARVDSASKLLIIGDFGHDPSYSDAINRRIASDDRLLAYRALLPRAQLLRVLSECKLFVFPSEYEAMSMMLLEAVSCKAPVICSDISANLEVVGTDYPYVYPPANEEVLTDTLRQAFRETGWHEITSRLYERCVRKFGWSNISRTYERIYSEMKASC